MALRWIEGFDQLISSEALPRLYQGSETTFPTSNIAHGDEADIRDGALYDHSAENDDTVLHTPDLVASPENSWILGFAFKSDNISSLENGGTAPYVAFRNSAGEQCRIEIFEYTDPTPKPRGLMYGWRLMRGVTELAAGTDYFTLATEQQAWVYFEFKLTIDNAAGSLEGRYKYVNAPSRNAHVGGGFTTMSWDAAVTSIDTQEQATTGADSLVISFTTGSSALNVAYDDLYLCDSTGTKNNDFLGRCFVTAYHITTVALGGTGTNGDGDTVEWTPVTAASTEDALQKSSSILENDKRITSDTAGQIHLARQLDLQSIDGASIIGVRLDLHAKMETTGSLSVGFMWRKTTATAAQIEFGTAFTVASTTTEAASVIAEDDPNTLTDWVLADMNSYQFGCKNNG